MTALEREQGTLIRDKRIRQSCTPQNQMRTKINTLCADLEVSKPQKNRTQNAQRRSRSPPGGRPGTNVDRYTSGARGGNNRGGTRDGYRPGYRSPSPRGYRDRYDDRYRARSRSPGYGRSGSGRYRSPSPKRDVDDDLPLPRRERRDVPDVQILVLDTLDRDFISWVESAFSSRSVRVDVLLLSPRLSEQAVVRRQIMEGVVAVVKLTRQNQTTAKIGLQIFDRRNGVGNVTFQEYDGLDPPIAVELVLRAKSTHGAPNQTSQTPTYGGGGYGVQPQQYSVPPPAQQYGAAPVYGAPQPPPGPYTQPSQPPAAYPPNYGQPPPPGQQPPGMPPNLQSLITNIDPNNLQNLLSSMNNTPQSSNPYSATPTNSAVQQQLQNHPALAGYLQGQQQQQQQQQGVPPLPGGGPGSAPGGGQVNMQDILARLGSYQR